MTHAEINLKTAGRNLALVKERVGKNVAILAIVKADAYSHGAVELSEAFLKGGAEFLAVADNTEGMELRSQGIKSSIVILNSPLPEEVEKILEYELTPAVSDTDIPKLISEKTEKQVKIHVEVDTGMGRGGLYPEDAISKLSMISQLENIIIEGIFTHFPSAGDRDFTMKQLSRFKEVILKFEEAGINIRYKHSANSAGILDYPESIFNMVRPGLCLYGIFPSSSLNRDIAIEPVLTLKSEIINVREMPEGSTLSYGRTYTTTRKTTIGTVSAGYSCGYDRRLSNKADVLVRGKRCPVVGTICMDSCLIDLSGVPEAEVGDEVVLIGRQGSELISAEELADKAGTVPHEIISRIHVRKIYTR